jgi:hypothetical protein
MNNRNNNLGYPLIDENLLSINNRYNMNEIDLLDGFYYHDEITNRIEIKNKHIVMVEKYLLSNNTDEPDLRWHFEHDPIRQYRDLPKYGIYKEIWTGPSKEQKKQWNEMLGEVLNNTMQLENKVVSVKDSDNGYIAELKDGDSIIFNN